MKLIYFNEYSRKLSAGLDLINLAAMFSRGLFLKSKVSDAVSITFCLHSLIYHHTYGSYMSDLVRIQFRLLVKINVKILNPSWKNFYAVKLKVCIKQTVLIVQCWFKLTGQNSLNLKFKTHFSQIGLSLGENLRGQNLPRI